MVRVIVIYHGFNAELEEELYFATRRRPDQLGENIVAPQVDVHEPDREGGIHHPKEVHQQHRFLSYNCQTRAGADALAARLSAVEGVREIKVIDDTPAPAEPAPEAPAAEPAAIAEEPAAPSEAPADAPHAE